MLKKIIFLLLIVCFQLSALAQVKLCSWNLKNFGKSKADTTITFIAKTLKNYDVIAIQEVVAGPGGAQAVARLANELNLTGTKWDYTISDPTSGDSYKKERYAFLWKSKTVQKKGKAWLEQKYHLEIDREPYFCTFQYKGKSFTVVNFHAITKKKQPETEIKYFKHLPQQYPDKNLIFVGDFNCPQSHSVFNPLKKMGYQSVFVNQKTSLKSECKKEVCLASEFDNIFYHSSKIKVLNFKPVLFYEAFASLKQAKYISDHIPITMQFSIL